MESNTCSLLSDRSAGPQDLRCQYLLFSFDIQQIIKHDLQYILLINQQGQLVFQITDFHLNPVFIHSGYLSGLNLDMLPVSEMYSGWSGSPW